MMRIGNSGGRIGHNSEYLDFIHKADNFVSTWRTDGFPRRTISVKFSADLWFEIVIELQNQMHVRTILKQDACLLCQLSIYCSFCSDNFDGYTTLLTHMSFMPKTNTVRIELPCITSGRNKIKKWAPKIRTQDTQMDIIFYVQLLCTLSSLHFANTWVRCRHGWRQRMDNTNSVT